MTLTYRKDSDPISLGTF